MTTILAVDDCPVVSGLLTFSMEDAGYTVLTAASGLEALETLANHRPALMLLDLHMPGLGGLEVLRAVKEHGLRPELPVVMLTSDADDWALIEAHSRRAAGYLRKPFETELLLWNVDRILNDRDLLWVDDEHVVKRDPAGPCRPTRSLAA